MPHYLRVQVAAVRLVLRGRLLQQVVVALQALDALLDLGHLAVLDVQHGGQLGHALTQSHVLFLHAHQALAEFLLCWCNKKVRNIDVTDYVNRGLFKSW